MTDDDPLEVYAERWYEPTASMHRYAVEPPADVDAGPRYYETLDGVRNRLRLWYE